MKKVIVSPYVEDGILKVHVTRVDRGPDAELGICETLTADGSWKTVSIYKRDPECGFPVPKEMTQGIVKTLSGD